MYNDQQLGADSDILKEGPVHVGPKVIYHPAKPTNAMMTTAEKSGFMRSAH